MMTMTHTAFRLTQLLLWLAVFFCLSSTAVLAASPQEQVKSVQTLEDTVLAVRYDQEPMESRLARLEQLVYGQAQTGSVDQRLERLGKALSASALPPLSPSQAAAKVTEQPAPSLPRAGSPASQPAPQPAYQPPATPVQKDATDYPTVTQMEQKVFGKTYTSEDIAQRLTRLEKQVFKMPQTGSLADRMDNLKLMVLGDTGPNNGGQMAYSDPYGYTPPPGYMPAQPAYPQGPVYTQPPPRYSPAYSNQPQYNTVPYGGTPQPYPQQQIYQPYGAQYPPSQYPVAPPPSPYGSGPYASGDPYADDASSGDPYSSQPGGYSPGYAASAAGAQGVSPDMLEAMSEVEKNSIGQTFPNDDFGSRLDRVETKIFGQTAPELSYEERMQRVIAVASAGGAPQTAKARAKSTMMNLLPIILTILPMILL